MAAVAERSQRRRRGRLQISRQLREGSFVYLHQGREITDPQQLERIKSLAIPPAWHDVEISASDSAKVQARGFDDAGRRQAIYHPAYRRRRDAEKFDRLVGFGQALPRLRRQVERDLRRRGAPQDKVVACVVKLMDQRYLRVGTAEYAKRYRSFGATTLRRRHARVTGSTLTFEFTGKSGQDQSISLNDPQLASLVAQLKEMPGYEIFRFVDEDEELHTVQGRHVNDYLKHHLGLDYSAKDFRTWGGTLTAVTAIFDSDLEQATTKKAITGIERDVVEQVSEALGNTPATARQSYIDPRVLSLTTDHAELARLRATRKRRRPRKYLSVDEQCLLELLSRSSRSAGQPPSP
ncbi:hypothetical protein GCM10009526_18040 [Glutamicibacter creatinolyticus]